MSWDPLWKDLCHELANGMAEIQGNPSAAMKRVCNPVWTHGSYRWGAEMLSLVVVTLYVGLGFFFLFHQRKAEETGPEGDNLSQVEEWWLSGEEDKRWNFCQVISVSQAHFKWKQSGRVPQAPGLEPDMVLQSSASHRLQLWQQQPWTSKTSMSSAFGGAFCEGVDVFTVNISLSSSTRNGESSKCEGQCQIIIEIRIYYLLF